VLQYLRQLFEYTAFVLAPVVDDRVDLVLVAAVAALVVLLFAALVVMPRRLRIAFPSVPVAGATPRVQYRVAPMHGRVVHHAARPRAPAMAL
jgi:hypothetical protein